MPEPPSLTPLALSANTTVVRLNYRLSKEYKYPAPVHDVLAGYDWVVNNLARGPPERSGLRRGPGNIGVCGELLGGSLAAALAMTECDPGTTGIRAAVLGNPITDWTAMYPVQKADVSGSLKVGAKRAKRPNSWTAAVSDPILSTRELLKARNTYFRIPEDYFDTFASPLLFFRTPCDDVPAPADPIDEIFASMGSSLREFNKKRRSNRRHPPLASKLDLPQTRIWVGEKNALKDQGIELAEAVARSITLYSGREKVEDGSGWDRVEVQLKEGLGFWGEAELMHMGSWFSEVLR